LTQPEFLIAAGRIVFGGFFVIAAFRNFRDIGNRIGSPTNFGWALPAPLLVIGYLMQFVGGLALILDIWIVYGAALLIVFLLIATPLYHNPLVFPKEERGLHIYLVLVNITLAAGLLQIIGNAMQ
jgi:putative oxidoreductase